MTPRGGGPDTGIAPSARPWRERLDDPDEPLYTVAVAVELLGIDSQTLRRLGDAISHSSARSSGNQRRYSRNDLEQLAAAAELSAEGFAGTAIGRIFDLERQVEQLTHPPPPA